MFAVIGNSILRRRRFALVAVVTANSNMFVDKMNGNDDGVIQEETVVTDSDGNTAVKYDSTDSGYSRQCGRKSTDSI